MSQNNVQLQDGNGPLAGLRNQIINGTFETWQRGIAISNSAGAYTADRWYAPNSGNVSRSAEGPEGLAYSASITGGADGFLYQGVELPASGVAGAFDVGTTWTLSFYVKTGASTQSVYSIVDFSDSIVGVNSSAIYNDSGSPFTATTSWQRVTRTFTISSTPNSGNLMLRVLLRCDNRTETLKYSGVQLEPGPVATPFEHRPIGLELSLCQRYFYSTNENASAGYTPLASATGVSGNKFRCLFQHPVQMRTLPTFSSTGNFRVVSDADRSVTSLAGDRAGLLSSSITADVGVTVGGDAGMLQTDQDTTARASFDAEL